MSIIKCKECNNDISNTAEACPHCGKKQRKKLSVIHWIGIFFFGAIFIAIVTNEDKTTAPSEQTTQQTHSQQTEQSEPAKPVKISMLLSAYKDNEVNADNLYKGHVIRTSGIIGEIKKDITDSLYVTVGTGDEFEIPTLQAFFSDENNSKLAKLKRGKTINIECQIDGLMMNVIGKNCEIK